ncbi:MAG: hypothetical protein ACYDAC_07010 [Candidatus Dormibacteria bacterium]
MTNLSRRTPPLLMGVAALALMLSVFPSVLHIPLNGPGSTAEIAPVPGQGQAPSNLSEGGVAGSGSVGSGGSAVAGGGSPPGSGSGPTPTPSGPPSLSQLQCGAGGRQTDDPLSPPCVSSWLGTSNGGATMHGVTEGRITALLGPFPYEQAKHSDYNKVVSSSDSPYTRTAKVLLIYFQKHFMTYGRTVQLFGFQHASPADLDSRYNHPFAVVDPEANDISGASDFTSFGMEYFNGGEWGSPVGSDLTPQADLQSMSPYAWSFLPTEDELAAATADWICHSIRDRPAARANDPALATKTRRIAIVYEQGSANQQRAANLANLTRRACGYSYAQVVQTGTMLTNGSYATSVSKVRLDGDTTVMCYPCSTAFELWQQEATNEAYYPEYLFAGGYPDSNTYARFMEPQQWNNATGLTWRWRQPTMEQSYWYRAYQEIDPAGVPDRSSGPAIYEGLMQLFGAIQMAGPGLTPASVSTGMARWISPSPGPFSPEARYAPGSSSFIKDFMEERWDPKGVPPGGAQGSSSTPVQGGCYRLVENGDRHDLGQPWPDSDLASARADWPCQADTANNSDRGTDQAMMGQ